MKFSQPGQAPRRDDALGALPAMLGFARQMVLENFEAGDAEADALRAQIEECVVAAHRLELRERMRPPAAPSGATR